LRSNDRNVLAKKAGEKDEVIDSSVTDRGARGRVAPPGKHNVKTGPPLVDILTFNIL